jgi:hypothetical protein
MQVLTLSHPQRPYFSCSEKAESVEHGRIVLTQPLVTASPLPKLSVRGSWLGFKRGEVERMELNISGVGPKDVPISISASGRSEGNFSAAILFRSSFPGNVRMSFAGINIRNFDLPGCLFVAESSVTIEEPSKKAASDKAENPEFKAEMSGALTQIDAEGVSFVACFNMLSAPAGTGALALTAALNESSQWQNQSLLEWFGPGEYSFAGRLLGIPKNRQGTVKALLMAKPNPRGDALAETTVTFPIVA